MRKKLYWSHPVYEDDFDHASRRFRPSHLGDTLSYLDFFSFLASI